MLSETVEIQLINRAIAGDQSAFKKLYEHHADALFQFLHQFSNDRSMVQDWTQRAFIKAFNKLNSFKMDSRFKTWLFAIGINEMRTDKRATIKFVELPEDFIETEIEENETEPLRWFKAKKAIRELPPQKKIILLLHVAEGYTHRDIGETLSIKEGTSRIILHRVKEELRNQLMP